MADHNDIAYLLLGSNIGDRMAFLEGAQQSIAKIFPQVASSAVYETEAWGDRSQQAYLNQAIAVSAQASPAELHRETRRIERLMGRTEKGNYQPRTIDIDILFYGDRIVQTQKLTIPHPRLIIRRFVLVPLCEIAPELQHPQLKTTIKTLLETCSDQLEVKKHEK